MVYYNFYDEEDKDQNPANVALSGAAPVANNQGTQNEASKQDTGSGFQNLDKYLASNQPQQFGQQVVGKVSGEVDEAAQNQQQAGEAFKTQVATANPVPQSEQVNQAIANPTQADAKQFQGWMNQTYQGPKSLADSQGLYNQYWSGAEKAGTKANLLGTESGRFSILDSYFGRPDYNTGQKSLDNLLVQRGGVGEQTQALQDRTAQLKTQGNQGARDLQNQASMQAGLVDQSRRDVRGAIGLDDQNQVLRGEGEGALGQQYSGVESQVQSENAQRQAQYDAILKDLSEGRLRSDLMSQFGLSDQQNLYDLDIGNEKYLTRGLELNRNQVMNPEQQSYIRALSELAGVPDQFALGELEEQTDPYTINADILKNDVVSRGFDYKQALQNTPITIPKVWTPGGSGAPVPISYVEQQMAYAQDRLANGNTTQAERTAANAFLAQVTPIVNDAKAKLAEQYQANRKLSSYDV